MTDFKQQLIAMNACEEAIEWVGARDLKTAWAECQRGDWMLWLGGRVDIDRKLLVLAACDCAETALKHVPKGEDQPRKAIETARNWCAGNAALEEVFEAAEAVGAAWTAGEAAWAAAWAARAARAAAWAARAAAWAAEAAWTADEAARAARAAEVESLNQSADLVRKRIPVELIERAMA